MPYATLPMLRDRYGDALLIALTDRATPPAGAIDADVVARALADADALIDAYLAARYALPLASVPPVLADAAAAIALWKLHLAAPDPKIEADYRDALKLLRDVADGRVRLDAGGAEPAAQGGPGVRFTDRPRFTGGDLEGFV